MLTTVALIIVLGVITTLAMIHLPRSTTSLDELELQQTKLRFGEYTTDGERTFILPPAPDAEEHISVSIAAPAGDKHMTLYATNERGWIYSKQLTNPVSADELLLEIEDLIGDAEAP